MPKHTHIPTPPPTTLSDIQRNPDLGYRIRVLLHDLSTVGHDPSSQKRLSATMHELYISSPYFTDAEAAQILSSTLVEPGNHSEEEPIAPSSIADTIHQRLGNFFEKRKASGDARPCGPHDMLPVYLEVFGVEKDDLRDEKFLGRLRRSGLGDFMAGCARSGAADGNGGGMNGGRKGKRGKRGR
ncbi:MAG: hypothetical protein Q9216_001616 [Gyalolechia sp. 2 TL-2023]